MADRAHMALESLGLLSSSLALSQSALSMAFPDIEEELAEDEVIELDDSGNWTETPEIHYGNLRGNIVGVKYYRGTVSGCLDT